MTTTLIFVAGFLTFFVLLVLWRIGARVSAALADDPAEEPEDDQEEDEEEDDEPTESVSGSYEQLTVYRGSIQTTPPWFQERASQLRTFLWQRGLQHGIHVVPPATDGRQRGVLYFWFCGPNDRVVQTARALTTWINGDENG